MTDPIAPISPTELLPEVCAKARSAGRFGIDTEFLPEGRYRPLLCLVQVVVEQEIFLFDPLEKFDPTPLVGILVDPAIEVVLHAGRQDIAIMRREWDTNITNVFDTQVAAGFAGASAQAGYTALLNDFLDMRVAKTATFTHWNARPLSAEQLLYAREDVEYLLPLADKIRHKLLDGKRLEWAIEECISIANSSDIRDPEYVWQRLPKSNTFRPQERAVAQRLAAWRERTAAAENRPTGTIMRDPTMTEIVRRRPSSQRELAALRGINPDAVRRYGTMIIAELTAGAEAEPIMLRQQGPTPENIDGALTALVEALLKARAKSAGVAYELIASRSDIAPIVTAVRRGTAEPDVRTLRGWRRELVGQDLVELINGRMGLVANDNGGITAIPIG